MQAAACLVEEHEHQSSAGLGWGVNRQTTPETGTEACREQAKHTRPEVRLWLLTTLTQLAARAPVSSTKAKLEDLVVRELRRGSLNSPSGCLSEFMALYIEEEPLKVHQ